MATKSKTTKKFKARASAAKTPRKTKAPRRDVISFREKPREGRKGSTRAGAA